MDFEGEIKTKNKRNEGGAEFQQKRNQYERQDQKRQSGRVNYKDSRGGRKGLVANDL